MIETQDDLREYFLTITILLPDFISLFFEPIQHLRCQ